ncbi:hypothetical protein BC940DRAFT_180389 [Gongronella butleri]|nr:hypothetical protein BC940DRAFT_180389 [Gongronella butleri]
MGAAKRGGRVIPIGASFDHVRFFSFSFSFFPTSFPSFVKHEMSTQSKPIKGILKHPHNEGQANGREPHLKWDEDNLQLTESQKDSTMKVDEPKTPYIRYNAQTDQVLNPPENLGYRARHDDIDDFALDGGHESDRSSVSSGKKARSVSISDDEWAESDKEEDEQTKQRHEEFAKKRAMHYNMKNALHQAIPPSDEDEDEDQDAGVPPVPPMPSQP